MSGWFGRVMGWLGRIADDALPMPAEQRDQREWSGQSAQEQTELRKLRLKLHILENRGKGGYR